MHAGFLEVLRNFHDRVGGDRYDMSICHTFHFPLEPEEILTKSWELYESLCDKERVALRAELNLSLASVLLTYSVRVAGLAVRLHDASLPYFGVIALTVDDHFLDERDVSRVSCVLYDSARRLDLSPEAVFSRAMQFAADRRRGTLEYYFRSSPDYMKVLRSMGFEAVDADDGFFYRDRMV